VTNFFSDDMRRNPYPLYAQVRGTMPVLRDPRADLWMIFDYQGAKRALSDHDAFSSAVAPSGGQTSKWFIFIDPPRHTHLRALVSKAFNPQVVANLAPRIRDVSRELLDRTIERGLMDLAADFAAPLPMMVIAEMMGVSSKDWPQFKRWGDAILGLAHSVAGTDEGGWAVNEFTATTVEMDAYLTDLVSERKAAPRDDLLTRLIHAEIDGERLTHEEILGFFQLLLVAGSETTANLIGNAILCFMDNPAELARLEAKPELLHSAIEEVLRYRSPVQATFRMTNRDIPMHGQVIPAGQLVLPMIGSANRDPSHFPDADRFDIGREPNGHIAFGQGIHFCLGASLSRLEGRIALSHFLERVKRFEPASAEPWQPRKPFHVHGPSSLPIRFQPGERAA
jgi:cytochrome P450